MNRKPWACWPAESAAWVQAAPPLIGWQLQPPDSGRAVPSADPLLTSPPACDESPEESDAPAGREITAVSGPDAVEPVSATWNVTRLDGLPPPRMRLAVSRIGAAAGAAATGWLEGDGLGWGDGDCDGGGCVAVACRDGGGASWRALAGVLSLPVSVIASAIAVVAASTTPAAAAAATRRERRVLPGKRNSERRCACGECRSPAGPGTSAVSGASS